MLYFSREAAAILSVNDFQDLLRLLDEHPEWQAELRQRLLPEELLQLPALVQQLVEAQVRTGQRLDTLAAHVAALAEAQARTEQRLDALVVRVDALTAQVAELTRALLKLAGDVTELVATVRGHTDRLGHHTGQLLEAEYRSKAAGRFGRIVRNMRVLDGTTFLSRLDDAVDAGQLSRDELDMVIEADIVLEGRMRDSGTDVLLVVEVSNVVDDHDVTRAKARSEVLQKLGRPVVPVVAGLSITPEVEAMARALGVWRVLDGRVVPPHEVN